ncbi:DUF3577 domain-containing protein [Pseudomonas aeruginosa]|uniref:DUF3577 domain-containing protein n=1 Tax=Pseudomonas aeruginosa TaxID=287 RepID=UPI000F7F7FA0|nr:DUF3577 domain-containing protein [Pseudomonas aeruginosa]RTB44098.1 DUF3577 domain-containing protein [Pseudomonas aeruginosa]
MTNNTSQPKRYFDLHTSGIGYLQRVREVKVKGGRKAEPFLACTVAAIVGPAHDTKLRYFDVRVSGHDAQELVRPYIGVEDPKQRPVVQFRQGDLWVDPYIRPSGEHQGQPAASMKGRLLKAELISQAEFAKVKQFEIITNGIGYLSNIKEVRPANGDPFWKCSIAALTGPYEIPENEKREYRYFDTIITNAEVLNLVQRCGPAVKDKRKVLIAFRLNDMQANPYIRKSGNHAGEAAASLESKLTHISLIKIDGVQVYSKQQTADAQAPQATASAPAVEPSAQDTADAGDSSAQHDQAAAALA